MLSNLTSHIQVSRTSSHINFFKCYTKMLKYFNLLFNMLLLTIQSIKAIHLFFLMPTLGTYIYIPVMTSNICGTTLPCHWRVNFNNGSISECQWQSLSIYCENPYTIKWWDMCSYSMCKIQCIYVIVYNSLIHSTRNYSVGIGMHNELQKLNSGFYCCNGWFKEWD